MKKKLLSLFLCICMCISFLTGCTLVEKDDSYKDNEVVMTVGETEITREELVNQYNSFYSQYYQYFMYYDSETMMDLFYSSVESRAIILEEANKLLANDSKFIFVDDEYEKIWYNIYDYIDSQLDTTEKALRLQAGTAEDDLPEWLKSAEAEEDVFLYEDYEPESIDPIDYSDSSKYTPATELDFNAKLTELKSQAIYRYVLELDEDEPRAEQEKVITNEADKTYRDIAFTRYIDTLMLAAKFEGETTDRNIVLEKEIKRLYKSYYESALYSKYQEYIEANGISSEGLLSADKVVNKFIELTNKDIQANASEEAYVDVITSSSNESLVLYHNGGEYNYFTVQHILIKFDDKTLETLKEHEGYDAKLDLMLRLEYEALREELAGEDFANLSTSYRDPETGLTVTEIKEVDGEEKTVNKTISAAEILAKVEAIYNNTGLSAQQKAYEFNKLSWQYSADTGSLTDKLSAKLGFTISSEADSHGSYVSDFTDGARVIFDNGNGQVGDYAAVLSDYGLHIMMLVDVYEEGTIVDITEIKNGETVIRDTDAIKTDLENTKVSNMTNQKLYEYIYDMLKAELVGTSGTYFSEYRNELSAKYEEDGKITYNNKLSYEELTEAIA